MLKGPNTPIIGTPEVRVLSPVDYYRSNKLFCNLQAVLLTTALSVLATVKPQIEITEAPFSPNDRLVTVIHNPKVLESEDIPIPKTQPTNNEISEDEPQTKEDEIERQKAKAFEEKLKQNFSTDRQKLIDKYQPYFELETISSELFDVFLFEYSFALETAIQKTKRDLGENQLSDDEIRSKVEENQDQLKEFLERSESIVRRSPDQELAISDLIKNGIKYSESQASLNGLFNSDQQPEGNCVTRALVASRTAMKIGLPGVGFALMPGHIAAVSSSSKTVAVMDTNLKRISVTQAGDLITGGGMLASLLAANENSGLEPRKTVGGKDHSTYEGLSPTGKYSKLKTPPRPKLPESKILTDQEYKDLKIKYARELSHLGDKQIHEEIKNVTEIIDDEKLRTEILGKLLQAVTKGMSDSDFSDAKDEIIAKMATQIRSKFSNPNQIGVDEALEKSDLVNSFIQLQSIVSSDIRPLTVISSSEEENARFNSSDLKSNVYTLYKPKTLLGLYGNIEVVDIANLSNLGDLVGNYKDSQPDEEPVFNQNFSVGKNKEENKDRKPLNIFSVHTYSSQLAELSQLDLSGSKSIFGIKKPLTLDELKKLNGFSGIINFAIDKDVDLNQLGNIDFSRMKLAADYRCMVKQLLVQNMDTLIIEVERNLRYLITNNILQDLQAKTLLIRVDRSDKELLQLVQNKANFANLNSGTNVRIEFLD